MNLLQLPGPDFLAVLLGISLAAVAVSFGVRWLVRPEGTDDIPRQVHPYAVAWLAGGPKRAVQAAAAQLLAEGRLAVTDRSLFRRGEGGSQEPLEAYILNLTRTGCDARELLSAAEESTDHLAHVMRRRGLATEPGVDFAIRLIATVPLLFPLALALTRADRAIGTHRPMAFLVMLTIALIIGIIVLLCRPARLTRAGAKVLRDTTSHVTSWTFPADASETHATAFSVGILGASVLPMELRDAFHPPSSSGWSGSDGGGCSSGGGDGGGCGGGCGGCGGCGG
jgi:uncharacterized protein (TIGR04222 family)